MRSPGSSAAALTAKGTGYLCPYWHLPLLLFLFSILFSSACSGCGISGSSPPGGKQSLAVCRDSALQPELCQDLERWLLALPVAAAHLLPGAAPRSCRTPAAPATPGWRSWTSPSDLELFAVFLHKT